VCCAAALASLDLIAGEDLPGNARRVGAVLHEKLRALRAKVPQIGPIGGKGLVAGVCCLIPGTREPDGKLAWDVVERSVEKGLLMFSPVGPGGGTIKISPPLVITEPAIVESVAVLEEAFGEVVGRKSATA
jgi:4-aminobutyrate aminotransferase / (S)-3-amino-2-methylpropionate transaminase / 5-aminovalerate transaminase